MGDQIHSVIVKKFLAKFGNLLVEISKFTLAENNNSKYSPTTHRFKVMVLQRTRMYLVIELDGVIPTNVYEFISIVDINRISFNPNYFDWQYVLGDVVGKKSLIVDAKVRGGDERINVDLEDESEKARVIILGQQTHMLDKYFCNGFAYCTILACQFIKYKRADFGVSMSPSMYYGRIPINATISEVLDF